MSEEHQGFLFFIRPEMNVQPDNICNSRKFRPLTVREKQRHHTRASRINLIFKELREWNGKRLTRKQIKQWASDWIVRTDPTRSRFAKQEALRRFNERISRLNKSSVNGANNHESIRVS